MKDTKFQLFIATTLDGFIAREDGSLDWLTNLPNPNKTDHGYNAFIEQVDVLLMGRKSYEELLTLADTWPYPDRKTYVFSSDKNYRIHTENTFLLHEISLEVIEQLRNESTANIWIVGGGEVITRFLNLNAIDEMTLSIIPLILGGGIRLFGEGAKETGFSLEKSESFETGVVNLLYKKL